MGICTDGGSIASPTKPDTDMHPVTHLNPTCNPNCHSNPNPKSYSNPNLRLTLSPTVAVAEALSQNRSGNPTGP